MSKNVILLLRNKNPCISRDFFNLGRRCNYIMPVNDVTFTKYKLLYNLSN